MIGLWFLATESMYWFYFIDGATDVGQAHMPTQQTVIPASYIPTLLTTIPLKKM